MRETRDSEESWKAFDRVFDPVLNKRTPSSNEALAALLSFYIGEHPNEDLTCELIARGKAVLPLLEKFRDRDIDIDKTIVVVRIDDKAARYDAIISSIKAGEHCERER